MAATEVKLFNKFSFEDVNVNTDMALTVRNEPIDSDSGSRLVYGSYRIWLISRLCDGITSYCIRCDNCRGSLCDAVESALCYDMPGPRCSLVQLTVLLAGLHRRQSRQCLLPAPLCWSLAEEALQEGSVPYRGAHDQLADDARSQQR